MHFDEGSSGHGIACQGCYWTPADPGSPMHAAQGDQAMPQISQGVHSHFTYLGSRAWPWLEELAAIPLPP